MRALSGFALGVVCTIALYATREAQSITPGPQNTTPPRQVTSSGKRDANPRWSPDGKRLLFESNRSGTSQLYVLDLEAGGEAKQITNISTGANNGIWSPDGSHVAFVSAVYPEFSEKPFAESDKLNKQKDEEREKGPV